MNVGESIRMAVDSIRANKLRASLTLLSIGIGVFAIICVATAVSALDAKVNAQLVALGRNSFFIQKFPAVSFGNERKYRQRPNITLRQANEFKRRMTNVTSVGFINFTGGVVAKYDGKSTDPTMAVVGTDETYMVNFDFALAEGRGLSPEDVELGSDVAVIGADVVDEFFRQENPLGKSIALDGHRYRVVGVLAAKGATFGESQDNQILVPISSASKYYFDDQWTSISIVVKTQSMEDVEGAIDQAIGLMRIIRRLPVGKENDFEVDSNESISETLGGFTQYVSLFGLVCGTIALVAAGVGIMNIMLVSVKERTREIGIRKAVGATARDIMTQFIIEAITLCQFGATLGIIFGLLGGFAIGALLDAQPPFPWSWVLISVVSCFTVGLLAGGYPAWKASRLDPIDALRYE